MCQTTIIQQVLNPHSCPSITLIKEQLSNNQDTLSLLPGPLFFPSSPYSSSPSFFFVIFFTSSYESCNLLNLNLLLFFIMELVRRIFQILRKIRTGAATRWRSDRKRTVFLDGRTGSGFSTTFRVPCIIGQNQVKPGSNPF